MLGGSDSFWAADTRVGDKRAWLITPRSRHTFRGGVVQIPIHDQPARGLVNERLKASVRAKVEHLFRVIKRQFGFAKVRHRGLKKTTAQLATLPALSHLWMARRELMALPG